MLLDARDEGLDRRAAGGREKFHDRGIAEHGGEGFAVVVAPLTQGFGATASIFLRSDASSA